MEWARIIQALDDGPKGASVNECTLRNLVALVQYGKAELLPPSTVGNGYYSSIVLDWNDRHTQIEVFEDRFEIYDFSEVPTAIQHVVVEEIGKLPDRLITLLGQLGR
jgi:hypothetical protein